MVKVVKKNNIWILVYVKIVFWDIIVKFFCIGNKFGKFLDCFYFIVMFIIFFLICIRIKICF